MNGYFQVVIKEEGTYLRCIPPKEEGRPVNIKEVMDYLDLKKLPFDIKVLNETLNGLSEEQDIFLCEEKTLPIREYCLISLSFDRMKATMIMYPPSTDGPPCTKEDVISALRMQKVVYGIDETLIDDFLAHKQYGTPCVVAVGKLPRQGSDAVITYHFKTDRKSKPQLREDGTVNYYDLDLVSHCKQGDLLAVLTPADPGEPGMNVLGNKISQKEVTRLSLKFGKNIEINEDKTEIRSMVDGHVELVDGTVFVSNIFEAENVDNSTGNIEYEGSVKVNGNVCANFSIKAKGNIEVKGTVESAYLEAGGNIVLARGINGMNKGTLVAGGNVISKFLENSTVIAGGYIETETIVHSNVQSKTEIRVSGRKANIIGGSVSAKDLISTKNLGTTMGITTNVVVGVDPDVSNRYEELKKELEDEQKNFDKLLPILQNNRSHLLNGSTPQKEHISYLSQLVETVRQLQKKMELSRLEMEECKKLLIQATSAKVEVSGELYPGVTVKISDSQLTIRDTYKFCCVRLRDGVVKVESL